MMVPCFQSRLWLVLVLLGSGLRAQPTSPSGVAYRVVNAFPGLTFNDPTFLCPVPGTNLLAVAEREGRVWTFVNSPSTTTKTLLLDLSAHTQGYSDSGLLGLVFHPQFGQAGSPKRGYFFVFYNQTPGALMGSPTLDPYNVRPTYDRLSRFTLPDGASAADPNSETILINQFDRDLWHNGGAMFFGSDGFLYLSVGDEGGVANQYGQSQKISSGLFSGVLRIDVDQDPVRSHPIRRQPLSAVAPPAGWPGSYTQNYFIPNDNPWLDAGGGLLEEFWAIGFRSPHRMTYDQPSGRIYLGDVGQDLWEEVDLVHKGGNYQWPYMEAFHPGPGPIPAVVTGQDSPPIYEYGHYNGNECVIGGYVYHGARFASDLGGMYLFGDYNSGRIWAMNYGGSGTPVVRYLTSLPPSGNDAGEGQSQWGGLTTFGTDAAGEFYLCTLGPSASIYTLAPPDIAGYLVNISARAPVSGGTDALIAGFYLGGNGQKTLLLRGVGPGLAAFGVPSPLSAPQLQLYLPGANSPFLQNSAWCVPAANQAPLAAAASSVGAFALAPGSNDAAVLAPFARGGATAVVTGLNSTAGIALAEIYDTSPSPGPPGAAALVNISARGVTGSGSELLTAGFVVAGNTPAKILVRGIGPALGQFGVTGTIPDPQLTIVNSIGGIVATGAAWGADGNGPAIAAAAQAVGAFALPAGSNDAAILLSLAPGAYTAQVGSGGEIRGQAMVEIYLVP